MERIIIIGTSVAANTVYQFIVKYNLYEVVGFAVNKEYKNKDTYLGKPVYEVEALEQVIDKKI